MARRLSRSSQPSTTLLPLSLLFLLALTFFSAHAQTRLDSLSHQSEGPVSGALREVLSERGLDQAEIDDVLFAVGARLLRLHDGVLSASKRAGWKRIPIQTRFAPFGTKLVPNRNRESSGPTLLRYGRSV